MHRVHYVHDVSRLFLAVIKAAGKRDSKERKWPRERETESKDREERTEKEEKGRQEPRVCSFGRV